MEYSFAVGDSIEETIVVENIMTAKTMHSGGLLVYGTPAMILLMESLCHKLIEKKLEVGFSTVGTKVDIKHTSPTPIGMKVTAKSVITEIRGTSVTFAVSASDEEGLIGFGTHRRSIIKSDEFYQSALNKLKV